MNYLAQIKGFWRSHEEYSFSTTEIALYFYLLEVCNICGWKNPFKRNNRKIETDLKIKDRRTLDNARNRLMQAGLLTCRKQSTNPNVTYTITPALNAQVDVQVNAQVDAQAGAQADESAGDTKDKLNQTKPDKRKKEKKKETKRFVPPSLEEVAAYCRERDNTIIPQQFLDYYTAKGWMIGKNSMKDWKAAVRTWEIHSKSYQNERSTTGGAGGTGAPNYGSV